MMALTLILEPHLYCRNLLHDGTAHLPAGLQHLDWSLEHVQRYCDCPPLLLRGDLHEEVPGPPPHVHCGHRRQHYQPDRLRGESNVTKCVPLQMCKLELFR